MLRICITMWPIYVTTWPICVTTWPICEIRNRGLWRNLWRRFGSLNREIELMITDPRSHHKFFQNSKVNVFEGIYGWELGYWIRTWSWQSLTPGVTTKIPSKIWSPGFWRNLWMRVGSLNQEIELMITDPRTLGVTINSFKKRSFKNLLRIHPIEVGLVPNALENPLYYPDEIL